MVGQIPEVRRAKRPRRSRGPVSLSHQPRASARHERGRRVRRLREEERSEFQAAGQRLHQEGRARFEAHLNRVTARLKTQNSKLKTSVPTRWRKEVERVLITDRQIATRIRRMAREIEHDFSGR